MNEELIDILKRTKEGKSIVEKNLQSRFKSPTSEIVMQYEAIKETDEESADRMLSYVLTGIVTMGTKSVDESLHILNKIVEQTRKHIEQIDKIINVD